MKSRDSVPCMPPTRRCQKSIHGPDVDPTDDACRCVAHISSRMNFSGSDTVSERIYCRAAWNFFFVERFAVRLDHGQFAQPQPSLPSHPSGLRPWATFGTRIAVSPNRLSKLPRWLRRRTATLRPTWSFASRLFQSAAGRYFQFACHSFRLSKSTSWLRLQANTWPGISEAGICVSWWVPSADRNRIGVDVANIQESRSAPATHEC